MNSAIDYQLYQRRKVGAFRSIAQEVEIYIEDEILEGQLKFGERLIETQIAEHLGISRGPVREAIQSLDAKGVLDVQPRKGARVANFVLRDLIEILEIRVLIESSIVETLIETKAFNKDILITLRQYVDDMLVTEKDTTLHTGNKVMLLCSQNELFHRTIWDLSKSRRRRNILDGMIFQLRLAMRHDLREIMNGGNLSDEIFCHYDILDSIEQGDVPRVKQLIKNHSQILR